MSEYVVEMHDIVKTFGHVTAVNNGQFTLKKGEIHSLIGENGAGKSTMMKLLYGMYPIDSGVIRVKGEEIPNLTPKTAIEHGIGMVRRRRDSESISTRPESRFRSISMSIRWKFRLTAGSVRFLSVRRSVLRSSRF